MVNIGFILIIVTELLVFTAIVYAIVYCDKRVIELQKRLEKEGEELVKSIKDLNIELIKVNLILEKINGAKKTNWLKIIMKALDAINLILLLAPMGKKIPFARKLFSIKSLKSIINLCR